jgi:hypothetical protein
MSGRGRAWAPRLGVVVASAFVGFVAVPDALATDPSPLVPAEATADLVDALSTTLPTPPGVPEPGAGIPTAEEVVDDTLGAIQASVISPAAEPDIADSATSSADASPERPPAAPDGRTGTEQPVDIATAAALPRNATVETADPPSGGSGVGDLDSASVPEAMREHVAPEDFAGTRNSDRYQESNSQYHDGATSGIGGWIWYWDLAVDCQGNVLSSSYEAGSSSALDWSWKWAWEWCGDGVPSAPPGGAQRDVAADTETAPRRTEADEAEAIRAESWNWTWTFTFCGTTVSLSPAVSGTAPTTWVWQWTWSSSCRTERDAGPSSEGGPVNEAVRGPPPSAGTDATNAGTLGDASPAEPPLVFDTAPVAWPETGFGAAPFGAPPAYEWIEWVERIAAWGGEVPTGPFAAITRIAEAGAGIMELAAAPRVTDWPDAWSSAASIPAVAVAVALPMGSAVLAPRGPRVTGALRSRDVTRRVPARPRAGLAMPAWQPRPPPSGPDAGNPGERSPRPTSARPARELALPLLPLVPRPSGSFDAGVPFVPSGTGLALAVLLGVVLLVVPPLGTYLIAARELRPRSAYRPPIDRPG